MTRRAFAQETTNLGTNSVGVSRQIQYSDIDLTLGVKPTGDVYKKLDAAAVRQSVKNLIMTNRLEKPFNENFGGNLRSMLFQFVDRNSDEIIKDKIINTIRRYEPRAHVRDVSVYRVNGYKNSISVTVTFSVRNTREVLEVNTNLTRIR